MLAFLSLTALKAELFFIESGVMVTGAKFTAPGNRVCFVSVEWVVQWIVVAGISDWKVFER